MFSRIAALVTRRGWLVVLVWAVIAVVVWWTAPSWATVSQDDNVRFFPPDAPSVAGQELLERGFPDDSAASEAVLIFERPDGPLTAADRAYVRAITRRLREQLIGADAEHPKTPGIKKVTDFNEPVIGPRLIGNAAGGKGQVALTSISIKSTYLSRQTRTAVDVIRRTLASSDSPTPPKGLTIDKSRDGAILPMTGSALVGHDQNAALISSMEATTVTTVVLVVLILLLVYRSPVLALIPLATIAFSVWVSLKGIALLTLVPGLHFQVINATEIFVIVVLFGAGTDYCLFLIARYREELARGRERDDALVEAMKQVGGALFASAGTVIVGLGMLYFSTFAKIQFTGPAIALSLAVSLAAALTLSPVLLHWLRGAVFWPFKPPHHEKGADPEVESQAQMPMHDFWEKVSDRVVRRPGRILLASLLILAPFTVVGVMARPNYGQLTDLGPDQPSIVGTRIVARYFPVGELGRTGILIHLPKVDFRTRAGIKAIADFTRRLESLRDVAEVRSIAQPLGPPPKEPGKLARWNLNLRLVQTFFHAKLDDFYVSVGEGVALEDLGRFTRVDVVFKTDPYSEESLDSLAAVRKVLDDAVAPAGPLAGAKTGLMGSTVMIHDLKSAITTDEHRMYILVTIGVYVILVLLIGRPATCLYLIATVIIGYLASLGCTELVFRALHTGPEPWVGLDWKVGFFLFVILVAVGEDYNIFLMSRVIEEQKKLGVVEGTRRAVLHTGGIISSCGLIMACTFGSMLTGSLAALRELGFALGLGVLLDTFVVRPVLVPAFVILLHRFRTRADSEIEPSADLDRAEASPTRSA